MQGLALVVARNENHLAEYLRIAKDAASEFNITIIEPREARREFESKQVYIIERYGAPVGVVTLEARPNNTVYIADLWIHSEYRGQGIGAGTLEFLADLRKSYCGDKRMTLHTHPNSPALHFYLRNGFVVEKDSRIENYLNSGTPRVSLVRNL